LLILKIKPLKKKIKLPTLDEFEANMKNCPLHKERSSQFKKGMIAGYIETIDMINDCFQIIEEMQGGENKN